MQIITRKGSFDAGHRVMNEKMKCFNLHGHTYLYELQFAFEYMKGIGYALDFKEIKRVASQWIDDYLDHAVLLNPKDDVLIKASIEIGSKMWIMSLNGKGEYCNPTVENIAREVFIAVDYLFEQLYPGGNLRLQTIQVYETPNCSTILNTEDILPMERIEFLKVNANLLDSYAQEKGVVEYDDRVESCHL